LRGSAAGEDEFRETILNFSKYQENLGISASEGRIENIENTFSGFREWLNKKYSKSWAEAVFRNAKK
jgi:LPS O-antigen subunit length determinant protein (WzzB/FepE family)